MRYQFENLMETVDLNDIETVSRNELRSSRLVLLINGYDSFDAQLNNSLDPVLLNNKRKPYRIISGRHKVYMARQKGYTSIPVVFVS